MLVPDLGGWRRKRLPGLPDTAFFEVTPDWVCEVLSPSTERTDRGEKLSVYRRERVAHVWLVSPAAQTLEVLRLRHEAYVLVDVYTPGAPIHAEPFDAVPLDLGPLFAVDASAAP